MRIVSVVLTVLVLFSLLMACTPQTVVSTVSSEPSASSVPGASSSAVSSEMPIQKYPTFNVILESKLTFPSTERPDSAESAGNTEAEPTPVYTVRLVQTAHIERNGLPDWISTHYVNAFYGEFELQVWCNGDKVNDLPLNPLFEDTAMMFIKPKTAATSASNAQKGSDSSELFFPLLSTDAVDLNEDGLPDYLLGQPAPQGGIRYILFSITPDGQIQLLPIENDYLIIADLDPGMQAGAKTSFKQIYDPADSFEHISPAGYEPDGKGNLVYTEYTWDGSCLIRTGRTLASPAYNVFPYPQPNHQTVTVIDSLRGTGITRTLMEKKIVDLQFYSETDLLALTDAGDVYYYGLSLPVDLRTQEMIRLPIPESIILMEDFCFATENGTIYIYPPAISTTSALQTKSLFYTVTLPKNERPKKMLLAEGDLFVLTEQGHLFTIGELGLYGAGLTHRSASAWNANEHYMQPVEVRCPERITDFTLCGDSHLLVMCESGDQMYHAPLYYNTKTYSHMKSAWQAYAALLNGSPLVLRPVSLFEMPTEESDGWVIDDLLDNGYAAARTVAYRGHTINSGVYTLSYPTVYTDPASLYTTPTCTAVLTYDAPPPPPAEEPAPDNSTGSEDSVPPELFPLSESDDTEYTTVTAFEPDRYMTLSDGSSLLLQPNAAWKLGKLAYLHWVQSPFFETAALSNIFARNKDYLPAAEILFCGEKQLVYRDTSGSLFFFGTDPLAMWSPLMSYAANRPLRVDWLNLKSDTVGSRIEYKEEYPGIPDFEAIENPDEEEEFIPIPLP